MQVCSGDKFPVKRACPDKKLSANHACPNKRACPDKGGARAQGGFTLIELIIVVVILGIVSMSISGIVRNAMELVSTVTERENLVRQGSFLVERFTRELNNAVPNSVRIAGNANGHCIEFVPLKWSTIYLSVPLTPQVSATADVIELIDIQDNIFIPTSGDFGIVYPSRANEVYDASLNHRQAFDSCSDDGDGDCSTNDDTDGVVQVSFSDGFATTSPSKRMYFASKAVSYCLRDDKMYRHESSINALQTLYTSGGDLMAQNLANTLGISPTSGEQNPFKAITASLQRNASTQTLFIFAREDERVTFMQEVQIPNVP